MNATEVNQEELCSQSSNLSCFGGTPLTAVDVVLYLSTAAVVLLTVCGNLLVIISICHFKQLHTPTNLLLLSLAMADLLVGVLVMPFYLIMAMGCHWCVVETFCRIYNAVCFYPTYVSVYNVAYIAVDRYFALSNPFFYSTKITVNLTLKIICMTWFLLFIYIFTLAYVSGNFTDMTGTTVCGGECSLEVNGIWAVVDFIGAFLVPCLIIVIMYLKVFIIAKKHANAIQCLREQHCSKSTREMDYSVASERKAAKTLGILVSVFLLCLLPYYIGVFIHIYIRSQSLYITVIYILSLLYINSAINPIIYALFYSWFQKCVKLILTLRICISDSSLINVFSKDT